MDNIFSVATLLGRPLHQIGLDICINNHAAATRYIKACRHGKAVQLLFRPNIRMGKKCDLSDLVELLVPDWFEYLKNC